MQEVKWGIIGCGDVVERKSGPAFQRVDNSKLIAVMRRDAKKAADFALRHNVPKHYNDAWALINDDEVNAIYIATPPSSHEEYAVAALNAGKNVYLEKPMALDNASALRIQEAAAKSTGKITIAHYRRELPAFKKVKNLLEEGAIGTPLIADIRVLQPANSELIATTETNWRINPSISGGGLFHDLAPHHLDLMLHFFGQVENACGFSDNQTSNSEVDDMVTGIIKFKNAVSFRGIWAFAVPAEEASDKCEILGTQGKISFSFFGSNVSIRNGKKREEMTFDNPAYVQEPMINSVVRFFLGQGDNPCSIQDGVEVMRIIDEFTAKVK